MSKKKRNFPPLSKEERQAVIALRDELAARYDEPNTKVITLYIRVLGAEKIRELAEQADQVIASGGMLTNAGDRPRTKGGVLFALARRSMDQEQYRLYRGRSEIVSHDTNSE